jgi:hypothetical protein
MLERARAGEPLTGGEIIVTDKGFAGHEFHASERLASR